MITSTDMSSVVTGKVKWFDIKKGYGYITDENGTDHFVHHTSIESGRQYTGFNPGDKVTFSINNTEKGSQAIGVNMVETENEEK